MMSAWPFNGKNRNIKDKKNLRKITTSIETDITKKLEEVYDEEISKSQDYIPLEPEGMLHVATGEIYYPSEYQTEKSDKSVDFKVEKNTERKFLYSKTARKVHYKPFIPVINADVTVVCIEITEDIERIAKFIKASLKFYNTKFYKFVFFSNNVYSTKVQMKSLISEESLLEEIKIQKEIAYTLEKQKILLYDAIDEALTYSKENEFCGNRIVTVGDDKFILNERKYLFVISGEECGSCISKIDLQKLLSKIRNVDADMHVVLTNSSNLSKVISLGFRTIKSY